MKIGVITSGFIHTHRRNTDQTPIDLSVISFLSLMHRRPGCLPIWHEPIEQSVQCLVWPWCDCRWMFVGRTQGDFGIGISLHFDVLERIFNILFIKSASIYDSHNSSRGRAINFWETTLVFACDRFWSSDRSCSQLSYTSGGNSSSHRIPLSQIYSNRILVRTHAGANHPNVSKTRGSSRIYTTSRGRWTCGRVRGWFFACNTRRSQ